jgi:hypothetical protein
MGLVQFCSSYFSSFIEVYMSFRGLILSLSCLVMAASAAAQQACDLPVDVVGVEKGKTAGGIIRGLQASDLLVTLSGGSHVPIGSLTYDAGPRRIVFVIDTARELPSDARKAEAQTAAYILDHSRPMDSFALITARGTAREVKFDQGRDAVKEALRDLSGDPREKSSGVGVLDAVEQGIDWLGSPKPGDAIFLMVMDSEGNHKTNHKKIAQVLEERHIRLFSIAFGFVSLGNSVKSVQAMTSMGLGESKPLVGELNYSTGDQALAPLVLNSGGYLHVQDATNERTVFKLAERMPRLQQMGMQFYQMIAEFYYMKVNLPAHVANWTVDLSETGRQKWTPIWSVYPQAVNSCAGQ